jgi:hypothetical protein
VDGIWDDKKMADKKMSNPMENGDGMEWCARVG